METKLHTLTPDTTVHEALLFAREYPRSSYPVVDGEGALLGTVTREDFYEFIKRRDTRPDTLLKQMPLAAMPTVSPETPVREVMQRFVRTGSNKALVVDDSGRLLGIATVMDLVAGGANGSHDGESKRL